MTVVRIGLLSVLAAACATAQTSTASTAPPHLISVVIENQRIEPAAIQVAAGRVILIVHNHSARRQVAPSLLSPSALSVKAFSLPAPNSKDLMDVTLSPGIYVLSEPGIPGTCRITVK